MPESPRHTNGETDSVKPTIPTVADSLAPSMSVNIVGGLPSLPVAPSRRAFHAAPPLAVAKYWSSSIDTGLSPEEVKKRIARLGENKLAEKKPPSLLQRFLEQVSDSTVLALLGAALIAAILSIVAPESKEFFQRFGDSIAILLIVILNAILGLVQGKRAEEALRALRDMTAPSARVLRGGQVSSVAATTLVPGDIVLLEEGDKVAADLRLITSADLDIEEAALTGESVPVTKDATLPLEPGAPMADRVNMAFMGTKVSRGRARGIVTNTGMHTELGRIAGLLATVEEEDTPLQEQLNKFGKDIVLGCIAVSAVVFIAGWLAAGQRPREMFLVAVSLAVAAIPEGLPAITTIVLAIGTQRMSKRRALVRRLPAIETLGCAKIICTDKTGTLTQNAMTVRRIWVAGSTFQVHGEGRAIVGEIHDDKGAVVRIEDHPDLELAVHTAAHASGAKLEPHPETEGRVEVHGDPTDGALLVLARKGKGVHYEGVISNEVPFTSSRRRATVIAEEKGRMIAFVRGAPEVILELCEEIQEDGTSHAISADDRKRIAAVAAAWGKDAMRVLALATREHPPADPDPTHWEQSLTFVGLVGIVDPPRPEVKAAIAEAKEAGIKTVMITGDHPATAQAIAKEIGLWTEGDLALSGTELDNMDQQRLEGSIERVRVVARATASHKLRIVEAFKARGLVCAMTGDGVNDAPAVKAAHIGVAMGKAGTEVTKEAADLVLADDNYATIIAAVEEGRSIYANIRKFIYFLLSSNAGIVLMVFFASILGWSAPLTAIQILWINLITNGLPALALGVDPKDPEQMKQPPRESGGRLMARREWLSLSGVGAVMAAAALFVFWWADGASATTEALPRPRTLAFSVLSISPMFHALNCRSQTQSIFQIGLFTNKWVWGAIAVGVALQTLAIYVPGLRPVFHTSALSASDVFVVVVLSAAPLLIGEGVKIGMRARGAREKG